MTTIEIKPAAVTWECAECKIAEITSTIYTCAPSCLLCLAPMSNPVLVELQPETIKTKNEKATS